MVRKAKKRSHGTGSLVRRGDSWILRIMVNGKIVQRGVRDPYTGERPKTKAEAERLASALRVELFSNGKAGLFQKEDKTVYLGKLNEMYLETFGNRWTKLRRSNWLFAIGEAMREFKTVDEINHARLGKYVQRRLDTPTWRGDKRSSANVNRELSVLKRLLNWSVQTGLIEKNPMKGFAMLEEGNSRDRILNKGEIKRLITVLEKSEYSRIRPIVLIAVTTGMRRAEILNLKWAGKGASKTDNVVDLETGVFDLQRTKSGKRKVPISKLLLKELASLERKSEWVFPSPVDPSKPISEIKKSFHSLLKEANIQGCRFHDLRHCAASGWIEAGIDIQTVKELLGHASITTTQRYLTSLEESKQKAVDGIAERILNGSSVLGDK